MKPTFSKIFLLVFITLVCAIAALGQEAVYEPAAAAADDVKPVATYDAETDLTSVRSRKLKYVIAVNPSDPWVKSREIDVQFSFSNKGKTAAKPTQVDLFISENVTLKFSTGTLTDFLGKPKPPERKLPADFNSTTPAVSVVHVYAAKVRAASDLNKEILAKVDMSDPSEPAEDKASASHFRISFARLTWEEFVTASQSIELIIQLDSRSYLLHFTDADIANLKEIAKIGASLKPAKS